MRRRRITSTALALLAAAVVLVPASTAAAAGPWATVNVCDTAGHPDGIGIRASMPGSRDAGERMFVRLRVQYRGRSGRWRPAGPQADSGWIDLGSARARTREVGRTFTIRAPSGGAFVLRGLAAFQWRRGATVVRRARRLTRAGHPGTAGAEPADYSAATCTIR